MATLKGATLTLLMGPTAVKPAPPEVLAALEGAQVTMAAGQRSGFQLTFAFSKTSPIARRLLPQGFFDPMIRVIMIATLRGSPTVLMDGPIRRVDVTGTGQPGENRLTVSGEDVGGYMDAVDLTGLPFPAMPPFARVALMMTKYIPFGVIPVTIPAPLQAPANPLERIPQQQGTDWEYANQLAREAGYVFYVSPGPKPGMNTAYWGPAIRVGAVQPALTLDMDHAANLNAMTFTIDGAAAVLPFAFVKIGPAPVPVPVPDIGLLKPPLAARPVVPTRTRLLDTDRMSMPEAMSKVLAGSGAAEPLSASGTLDVARYGRPLRARQ
ncbi:MAG: hypothetical protein ACK4WC_13835, partial [Rubrimonas sp.]